MSRKSTSTTPEGPPRRALQENSQDQAYLRQGRPSASRSLFRSSPHRNMDDSDSPSEDETPPPSRLLKRKKPSRRSPSKLPEPTRDDSPIRGMVYDGTGTPSPRKSPTPKRSTMTVRLDQHRIVSIPSTECARCAMFMSYHSKYTP